MLTVITQSEIDSVEYTLWLIERMMMRDQLLMDLDFLFGYPYDLRNYSRPFSD